MRTIWIGGIGVTALLVLACGNVKLPELGARGDDAARAAIAQANERIRTANAAMAAKKPGKETKAFVDEVARSIEAFTKDAAPPDVARVVALGHAADVIGQAVGAGPDRPLDAALAYFARRMAGEPAQWSGELEQLAAVLDLHGVPLSRTVASELRAFGGQVALDVSAIQAAGDPQAPCRAGGVEQPVGVTAGRLVAAILAASRPADAGWTTSLEQGALCRTEPAQLVLSRAQGTSGLTSTTATLAAYGLNLRAVPAALVRDAAGQTAAVSLAPVVKATSRIEIPLHGVSFPAELAAGARIVLALQGGKPSELTVPILAGVKAEFDAVLREGTAPLQVMFGDRSAGNPTGWRWAFGDGTSATEQHPKHVFARPGSYTVQLTVTRPDSNDTAVKQNYVTVRAPALQTRIVPPAVPGTAPTNVTFTQEATRPVTSVCWTFGDGPTSVCQTQVTHRYQSAGTFIATVRVRDEFGTEATASAQVVVAAAQLVAAFDATPASGPCPLTVQFTNTSLHPEGGTSWRWVFSDTNAVSSTHNVPPHVYRRPGSHPVTMTATYQSRQSTVSRTVNVQPQQPVDHYYRTYTRNGGLLGVNDDWDAGGPSCGAGFRRVGCSAEKRGHTNANCSATWRTADPHDCRCRVHIGIHSGASITCEIRVTKVNEACAQ